MVHVHDDVIPANGLLSFLGDDLQIYVGYTSLLNLNFLVSVLGISAIGIGATGILTVIYADIRGDKYKLHKIQDLYDHFPTFLLICTLPTMVVIHIAISFLLNKMYFRPNQCSGLLRTKSFKRPHSGHRKNEVRNETAFKVMDRSMQEYY